MKKLNPLSSKKWFKKKIRNQREVYNLKYLNKLVPNLIPPIKLITNNYYILEKCNTLKLKDFEPTGFFRLYNKLLLPLHAIKKDYFTPGIYKYHMPFHINQKIRKCNYMHYIWKRFEESISSIPDYSHKLQQDMLFYKLIEYLKKEEKKLNKWNPHNGYSLLHGDLHIGNIVKKNEFFLIDFEYLRYGAVELEIANLVISSLIYFVDKGVSDRKLMDLQNEYFQMCSLLTHIDKICFNFFFYFSLGLSEMGFYLNRKFCDLGYIRKIISLSVS